MTDPQKPQASDWLDRSLDKFGRMCTHYGIQQKDFDEAAQTIRTKMQEREDAAVAAMYLKACNDYKEFGEDFAYAEAHKLVEQVTPPSEGGDNGQ
jgi:hypothetical protein